ncbi:Ankyrin repeat-containing protein [Jannaschia faecimaris]|uniref:Ankyrin repeat-containing protein n=1 Tax=Jannaschia faecimaris TaxID=1244108 RepID=A0A1H3U749_9RHOB|nr:ankyrin repeat domain-containing protein [Jannaschia faecimaris]SDZ58276.1 Ankyrin repeat-containing protein [Jannaschia faecimaris]
MRNKFKLIPFAGRMGVCATDQNDWTALHIAAWNGMSKSFDFLLAQPEMDVNAMNKRKSTLLMIASRSGNLAVLELLLGQKEAKVDTKPEYCGRTAIIEAAVQGHISVVQTLIAHDASVNLVDKTGRNSALIEALKNGHDDISLFLLRSGLSDFSAHDLRLRAAIWCGRCGNNGLLSKLDIAMRGFFNRLDRASS